MNNRIKHIFFDLDHTLWDFDKNSRLTFEKIFKLNKIDLDLSEFLEVYEPINLRYWKMYREERVSKADLRYGRLKDALDSINVRIGDEMINHLSVAYIDHLTTFNHLFDGTFEILEYLQLKYHLHIITNGFQEAQERKMINSNIRSYFKTVTNSEMVGVKKPNPKIFNFALNQANAKSNESIMIGDSLEADIEGAKHVGMSAILFTQKSLDTDKIKVIHHLKELKNHL